MTRVMVYVDGPNPEGNGECQQGIPVALNVRLNLGKSDCKKNNALDNSAPGYFDVLT